MQRLVVNLQTGERQIINLTPEEIAALPGPQPEPVPQVVSRFQAKAALAQAGLLAQADAVVAASGNAVLQLAWAEANEFRRDSAGINSLAPAIGLNSAALDDLFRVAAGIVA